MNVQSNPGGFPRFFALNFFNRCIFLTALRRIRSIDIYVCRMIQYKLIFVDETGYDAEQIIKVEY